MAGFFRILAMSPRLTIMCIVMIVGAIGGKVSHSSESRKSSNAWSKENSGGNYSAQKRFDDGWGSSTRASNARDNGNAAVTTQKVWRDKDGVTYEEEDIKAYDRSEYE